MNRSITEQLNFAVSWLLGLVCFTWSSAALAENCDDLEDEALTACLMVLVCAEIEESRAKNQCLEVVRQILDDKEEPSEVMVDPTAEEAEDTDSEPQERVTEEISEEVTSPVEALEEEPVLVQEVEEPVVAVPVTNALPSTDKETNRRWLSWLRLGRDNAEKEVEPTPVMTIDGVPKEFAATVVSVTKSGYNDALVILDNQYVFLVKRATQSRIEKGNVIVAQKKEGLSGRLAFLFYGRGASVDAQRIDCQHVHPSRQTKKRCEFATKVLGTTAL